ncbi:signal recognition particle-docking protein FtsY [Methanobrevibacter sp. TMH8]|uniref:signal recognition particle-docking protein FtsY n=1 Tax=Methanobrevibacter sp. TMH8 TaxID=2848611 RepID=UPI001CCFF903|nr:signal recognition particle-docking protein FtsY [Methanobrevibacter sp. TMH8]MBZ9570115.1 signal recognition particle-docking protein FtsY [Methanobrevibacter sp. TMH8]
MFESIKKKFADASGKLTNKVSKEAEEENNIKIEGEISEDTKDTQKTADLGKKQETEEKLQKSEQIEEGKKQEKDQETENQEEIEKIEEIDQNQKELEEDENKEDGNEKESTFSKIGGKLGFRRSKEEDEEKIEVDEEEKSIISQEEIEEEDKDKKSGIFSFIREKTISEKDVDEILWELELSLLESDVAIDVANFVVESVKKDLIGQKIKRSSDVEEYTYEALKKAVSKIIDIDGKSMTEMIEEKKKEGKPLIVMFVGINGTGKTTTIGKLANYYMKKGYTPVVAASDTFRAGAIEQITYHTDKLGVKIVKHEKGSDPAAVAFDAVEHAKAQGKELVLIDTAGRMQTNTNLMDEMKKIRRVSKPDLVIFVGDALTGNDAVEQASKFNDAIDVDGVILTKADADSKGGASLSIGYVIGKPIMFLGVGQGYDDIKEYDPDWMLEQIFS